MRNYNLSAEGRANLIAAQSKPKSIQTRKRMSAARKGLKFSDEHKQALSAAIKSTGTKPIVARGTIYSSAHAAERTYTNMWRRIKLYPDKFAYI